MTTEETRQAIGVYLEQKTIDKDFNSFNVSEGVIIYWGFSGILQPTDEELAACLDTYNSRPKETSFP